MERRKEGNGLETFLEHWNFLAITTLSGLAALVVFSFFGNLTGRPWIYFLIASTVLLISGAALILYAKIPVYRSGQFFTFGVKTVPVRLAGFYRWGWRVFILGVVLSLCLLLAQR
jgi:hypothetical protein